MLLSPIFLVEYLLINQYNQCDLHSQVQCAVDLQ